MPTDLTVLVKRLSESRVLHSVATAEVDSTSSFDTDTRAIRPVVHPEDGLLPATAASEEEGLQMDGVIATLSATPYQKKPFG